MTTTDGARAPAEVTSDGAGNVSNVPAPAAQAPAETNGEDRTPTMDELRSLRAEAKQHRLARRAAEQERDQLRTRVDAHDRAQVERLAGDRLQNASDVWLVTDLASQRDEEGQLDVEKVNERVEAIAADRPHWRKGRPDFSSGVRAPIKQPSTIGQALKNALGGR